MAKITSCDTHRSNIILSEAKISFFTYSAKIIDFRDRLYYTKTVKENGERTKMLHKTLTLIRVTKNFVNIGDVLKNRDLLSQIPDSEGVFFVFNKDKVEIKFAPNLTNPISGEKITVARPK